MIPTSQKQLHQRRSLPGAPLLTVGIDPTADMPMHRQLYFGIREKILATQLKPGSRLPSSRALARDLDISRNTVIAAFEQLHAEGYIEGKVGSGSFVSQELPEESLNARLTAKRKQDTRPGPGPSRRGERLARFPGSQRATQAFTPGLPELASFPFEDWSKLLARYWRRPPQSFLIGSDTAGWRPLRETLSQYLGSVRAVLCEPEQIFIVSGAQQAIDLTMRALVDPGDTVWVEEPGYAGLHGALVASGATIQPIPVDAEGIDIQAGMALSSQARMACVSPSHQYPLGITMSLSRRLELLEWARDYNAFILEDDYDSEYRYAGRPLAALQGLDSDGRVIYVGTMSKVMFPGIRLGYMVVPTHLVDTFRAIRGITDSHPTTIAQPALAEFIAEGHLAAHIRRMRALYAERQAHLLRLIQENEIDGLTIKPSDAGMHLVGYLEDSADDLAISREARAKDIVLQALSGFYHGATRKHGLLFGYAGISQPVMERAIARIAPVIKAATS